MATEDFRRLFDALRVPIAGADAHGLIAFANAAFVELAAHRDGALPGRELAVLFAQGDRKRLRQAISRVGDGTAVSALLDLQLLQPAQDPRWVSVTLQPWMDSKDRASGVIAVMRDIATERDTEQALNLSAARLLALAESSPAATMIETAGGEVELANEAFCRLLGIELAPQSLPGLAVADALARSPLVEERALKRVLRSTEPVATLEVRRRDGGKATIERRLLQVEGEAAGALWTAREEGAGGKSAAQVALIEKVAHELSAASEGLSTLSARAQRYDLDAGLVTHIHRIRQATDHAMAAIGDLVDFSRLSGDVVLQKQPFALRAVLAELLARLLPVLEDRGARLKLKVEQDVSDALEGDVERLQLVLRNLVESALAVAPSAEITLLITPEYTTDTGIQLSFAVVLGGPGATQPLRYSPEAGLGVAVARFMVAAMGGKLAIASRAVPETALYAFTAEFPVRSVPPARTRPSFATLVGMTVLVVSGDPAQRNAVAGILRGWRMLPLEADNAPTAMALLERLEEEGAPIPLVLLANRLPGQDGFLLAFRIKHHPKLSETLVMMLASDGRPGDAIACRENGVAAYMRWPIGEHQLHEAVVAMTGAAVDADEAPTLVTRHSLREQRKGATVLLVDGNRDSQILAAHILGREDCNIVVAHDLPEAQAALEQDTYDAVLVDVSMPGMSGPELVAQLRQRIARDREATRFIAMAADPPPGFREREGARGFAATLAKPLRREELLALLAGLGPSRSGS